MPQSTKKWIQANSRIVKWSCTRSWAISSKCNRITTTWCKAKSPTSRTHLINIRKTNSMLILTRRKLLKKQCWLNRRNIKLALVRIPIFKASSDKRVNLKTITVQLIEAQEILISKVRLIAKVALCIIMEGIIPTQDLAPTAKLLTTQSIKGNMLIRRIHPFSSRK